MTRERKVTKSLSDTSVGMMTRKGADYEITALAMSRAR